MNKVEILPYDYITILGKNLFIVIKINSLEDNQQGYHRTDHPGFHHGCSAGVKWWCQLDTCSVQEDSEREAEGKAKEPSYFSTSSKHSER